MWSQLEPTWKFLMTWCMDSNWLHNCSATRPAKPINQPRKTGSFELFFGSIHSSHVIPDEPPVNDIPLTFIQVEWTFKNKQKINLHFIKNVKRHKIFNKLKSLSYACFGPSNQSCPTSTINERIFYGFLNCFKLLFVCLQLNKRCLIKINTGDFCNKFSSI